MLIRIETAGVGGSDHGHFPEYSGPYTVLWVLRHARLDPGPLQRLSLLASAARLG